MSIFSKIPEGNAGNEFAGKTKKQVMEDFQIEKDKVKNNTTKYGNNSEDLKY